MANLIEIAQWENGIYRIDDEDEVDGGEDGVANKGVKQLGNRTAYLKVEQDIIKKHIEDNDFDLSEDYLDESKTHAASSFALHEVFKIAENALTVDDFQQTTTDAGWCKLPNGLILQWGQGFFYANSSDAAVFAIPFPVKTLACVLSPGGEAQGDDNLCMKSLTNSGFTIFDGDGRHYWFAVGF